MALVRNGAIVEDRFARILDDAAVPDDIAVIAPAARLLADAKDLLQRNGAIGVLWPNDGDVSELAPHLERLAVAALAFPNFRDGRAYSQARILRERYHFRGELRATGQVLRDQFLLMQLWPLPTRSRATASCTSLPVMVHRRRRGGGLDVPA
jgi:uncharacterized protein (DUF934 family)